MSLLSLPLSLTGLLGKSSSVWFPLRIPLTLIPRTGLLALPASSNEPLKSCLMALFRLAWSNRIQLPVLITVGYMAFSLNLRLYVSFFWEPTRRRSTSRGQHRYQALRMTSTDSQTAGVNPALEHEMGNNATRSYTPSGTEEANHNTDEFSSRSANGTVETEMNQVCNRISDRSEQNMKVGNRIQEHEDKNSEKECSIDESDYYYEGYDDGLEGESSDSEDDEGSNGGIVAAVFILSY